MFFCGNKHEKYALNSHELGKNVEIHTHPPVKHIEIDSVSLFNIMQMNFTLVIKRCVYCCYYIFRFKLCCAAKKTFDQKQEERSIHGMLTNKEEKKQKHTDTP